MPERSIAWQVDVINRPAAEQKFGISHSGKGVPPTQVIHPIVAAHELREFGLPVNLRALAARLRQPAAAMPQPRNPVDSQGIAATTASATSSAAM